MPDVELQISGEPFTHWTELHVGLSMEHVASSFEVAIVEPIVAGEYPKTMEPANGNHARVLLEGDAIVDGYVFGDSRNVGDGGYSLRLRGASRAADLVDCDPVDQTEIFRNETLERIVKKLVADYGLPDHPIAVRIEGDQGDKFAKFAIEAGETVFAAIDRLAKARGFMVMSEPDGSLLFTRLTTETPRESIDLGINVISASAERDDRDVFSYYYFYGQTSANNHHFAKAATNLRGVVDDPRMTRFRPRVGLEGQSTRETPEERARWESNVRYGRGRRFVYELNGWRTSRGGLWEPNTLVNVSDPVQHVYGEQLVCAVRLSLTERFGKRTELTVCPPEAFTLEAA